MEALLQKFKMLEHDMELFKQQITITMSSMNQRITSLDANSFPNGSQKDRLEEEDQRWPLSKEEYLRYGRQLIMPEMGMEGQLILKRSSVLIVGAGGLGCPAAAYLARAGVGRIGIADGDTVEISNLHRQILHVTSKVAYPKVMSAIHALREANPLVEYVAHDEPLTSGNVLQIFEHYDLVLDCTDTPASRYLISDGCVLLGKPLVSASALRTEGQLMALNWPPGLPGQEGGPCYRCIFPKPPPSETVLSCGEGGIVGPIVGVMGVLQALDAIKVLTKQRSSNPLLLMFSGYNDLQPFRTIRLRGRKRDCATCSSHPSITKSSLKSGLMDYVQFCGSLAAVDFLSPEERITASEFRHVTHSDGITLDVRERVQFELCALDQSINVPLSELSTWKNLEEGPPELMQGLQQGKPIHVVCRLGNDSQIAVRRLQQLAKAHSEDRPNIVDLEGGLRAWRLEVDPDWPEY